MSTGAAGRHRGRYVESGPVLKVALLMLAIQTVWRGTITFQSYFWQDDFRYLADAHSRGLSAGFLLQDYNGHVMPGQFFVVWVVSRLEFSFVAPAVTLVALQLVASALLLWVLLLLWPGRPEVLVGYAIYLFSPLGLVAGTWWAAGLQALPLQCTMLLALAACIKDHRTPGWRWKALTVLALVLGLVFWEKALLIIPLLVLVQLLLLDDARWADRRLLLRRYRAQWSVWLLVGVAYTVGYLVIVGRGEAGVGARASYQDFLLNAVVKMLLPGVVGGPWTQTGGENTVYPTPGTFALAVATTGVVLLAGWAWSRQPRAALRAGLLLGAYLFMDLGLVLLARSDFALLLARDPRYVTDALPVVAIAVTAAFAPAGEEEPSPHWTPQHRLLQVCVAVCAVLVASSWISVQALKDQLSHAYAKAYVTRLLAEHQALPEVVIVDAAAPPVGVVAQPVGVVFAAAGQQPIFDQPSADLRMADGFGFLAPVVVPQPEFSEVGPQPGCGWPASARPTRVFTHSGRAGVRRVVQLGYFADRDTALLVGLSPIGVPRYVAAPAGFGHLSLLTRAEAPMVTFVRPAGAPRLCVTDLTVGAPWPGS
ncbi:hypothetical protein [Nocardioides mesophilus]|uniref:DUF2079 domain-containing protein n=1 Tax=Nocardioides mesophilus TaxID=433659 RepID=A0A7G9RBR2_9ACTN|nr:hypothetical protein [Nocardioides mesophilus]QNN53037.1 hypothetical protein H9L09_00570 [Nocardioides mesophilus]